MLGVSGFGLPVSRCPSRKELCYSAGATVGQIGGNISFACQDWAATKAAYRFPVERSDERGQDPCRSFSVYAKRFAATAAHPVQALYDTTEFSYHRDDPGAIGILKKLASPYANGGKPGHHTTCGMLMHSSLVVTTDGLPLGLAAIKFWDRRQVPCANAFKRCINPTRVPIKQK